MPRTRGVIGLASCLLLGLAAGPAVAEPVRLHVDAKRYLCQAEPAYAAILSPASVRSLELQGGTFRAEEAAAWRAQPQGIQ